MMNHHILAVAITIEESEADMNAITLSPQTHQHPQSLLVQLHSLSGSLSFWLREISQPNRSTAVTSMDARDAGKARRKAPSMEEVAPVDVVGNFLETIVERLNHRDIEELSACRDLPTKLRLNRDCTEIICVRSARLERDGCHRQTCRDRRSNVRYNRSLPPAN